MKNYFICKLNKMIFHFFQICVVLIFIVGVIVYKLLVFRPLASYELTAKPAPIITSINGAGLNLICLKILSKVCSKCDLLSIFIYL